MKDFSWLSDKIDTSSLFCACLQLCLQVTGSEGNIKIDITNHNISVSIRLGVVEKWFHSQYLFRRHCWRDSVHPLWRVPLQGRNPMPWPPWNAWFWTWGNLAVLEGGGCIEDFVTQGQNNPKAQAWIKTVYNCVHYLRSEHTNLFSEFDQLQSTHLL